MNVYLILIGLLTCVCSAVGGFMYGVDVGDDRRTAAIAREDRVAAIATESAASAAAAAIAKIKVQQTTINNEVQREVQTNTVYRECVHSPEQLQRINDALTGERAEPAGRGLVPRADALGGRDVRVDDAQADRGGGAVP